MVHEEAAQPSLEKIVASNRERLEQVLGEAQVAGGKWVVECRDLWDVRGSDGGVYFVICKRDSEVDRIARRCREDQSERLLGVMDASRSLDEQWPGLTRQQWLARRAAEGWRFPQKLVELFKRSELFK